MRKHLVALLDFRPTRKPVPTATLIVLINDCYFCMINKRKNIRVCGGQAIERYFDFDKTNRCRSSLKVIKSKQKRKKELFIDCKLIELNVKKLQDVLTQKAIKVSAVETGKKEKEVAEGFFCSS